MAAVPRPCGSEGAAAEPSGVPGSRELQPPAALGSGVTGAGTGKEGKCAAPERGR